jgi:prolipoprotein diacylglyceryltransferase
MNFLLTTLGIVLAIIAAIGYLLGRLGNEIGNNCIGAARSCRDTIIRIEVERVRRQASRTLKTSVI